MKKIFSVMLILLITLMGSICAMADEPEEEKALPLLTGVAEEKLIIPGEGLGKIRFGATIADVEKEFGRGKIVPMEADFSGNKVINLTYEDRGLSFSFDSGVLTIVGIKASEYATKEGLRVGVDVGDVIRVLGADYKMQKAMMDTSSVDERAYDLYYDTISINVKGQIVKMIKIRTKKNVKKR